MKTITNESERGCGFRKAGGLYLVAPSLAGACTKLPHPLRICPCCGAGIKPTRGWNWIDPRPIIDPEPCGAQYCHACPLGGGMPERAALIWIGERYYPTPEAFAAEVLEQGVSRRIKTIPRGFELGKTWVFMAHRKAIAIDDPETDVGSLIEGQPTIRKHIAGIVHVYRPQGIEYILTAADKKARLSALHGMEIQPKTQKVLDRLYRLKRAGVTLIDLRRTDGKGNVHGQ